MRRSEFPFGYELNPPRRAQLEKVLRKLGWKPSTMQQKPHVVWFSPDGKKTTSVCGHKGKDLPYGTFRSILRDIGITEQRFYELL